MIFGERPFTVREFADRVGTPRAAKVLNELKTRGYAERTGRGTYRLLPPSERPDLRTAEWQRIRMVIRDAPFWKAWTGPSAVEAWTRGRYKVSPSPFNRDFHVRVRKADLSAWHEHLRAHHVPTGRKHIGAHVHLEPVAEDLSADHVDGEPVIPRADVVYLIRANPALYGDAEVLLA